MRTRRGFVIILMYGISIVCACQDYGGCPEGLKNCGDGNCAECCNDEHCSSGETCVGGKCEDYCSGSFGRFCTTHYCPATGTFECSVFPSISPVSCTCPVEGGCDYTVFLENCAFPPDCVCDKGKCFREPDCQYGVVCPSDDPPSCECAQEPVKCVDANRTCEEIADDMLEFHEANSHCTDEFDCTTIGSYVNLVESVCCQIYTSTDTNTGIWYALEMQLGTHDPQCSQYLIETCCMAPAPLPRCVEGHCG